MPKSVLAFKSASEEVGELVAKLFGSVGKIWRADEKLFDAIVGLSGSGLAYIYLAIEALADGGVAAGLPRELAMGLASQTVLHAFATEGAHCNKVREMLNAFDVWGAYKDQKHDLFLPSSAQSAAAGVAGLIENSS